MRFVRIGRAALAASVFAAFVHGCASDPPPAPPPARPQPQPAPAPPPERPAIEIHGEGGPPREKPPFLCGDSGFPLNGFPRMALTGDFVGYAVWHTAQSDASGKGWQVLVSTTGKRHHFKGRIWVTPQEGAEAWFANLTEWKSSGEARSEVNTESWFHKAIKRRPEERPTEISFDIVSQGGHSSGVAFDIVGQGTLDWQLGVGGPKDGDPLLIDAKHVKLGREGRHPPTDPFTTCVRPDHHGG